MNMIITPGYKDIFCENPPEIKDLLYDIPSDLVICFLSFINAQLFHGKNNLETQFVIIELITKNFPDSLKSFFNDRLAPYIKRNKNRFHLFAINYTLELIQYELLNKRNIESFAGTNFEQEFRIFKAYLICVEKVNAKMQAIPNVPKGDPLYFQKVTWGNFVGQYEFNYYSDPIYQAIKALSFLNFFKKSEIYQVYHQRFLSNVGKKNSWEYVSDFIRIVEISNRKSNESKLNLSAITPASEVEDYLLRPLSINNVDLENDEILKQGYEGIKRNPLYYHEGAYFVLNWNYLYEIAYFRPLVDFYQKSGIQKEVASFPDFLNLKADYIFEKIIFKNLLSYKLEHKYCPLFFDDKSKNGLPDCYYRKGNYIFLFEFKDMLMSAEVSNSNSFEKIEKYIEGKLIKKSKGKETGINQLANSIAFLNEKCYKEDDFEKKKINRTQLKVFPIIVYTSFSYSLSGVQEYLNIKFFEALEKRLSKGAMKFKEVNPIIMIELETIYRSVSLGIPIDLPNLCKRYLEVLKKKEKKFRQNPSFDSALNKYVMFENVNSDHFSKENREFDVNKVFELLEIDVED